MAIKINKKIIIAIIIVILSVAALGWFVFFYELKQIQNTTDNIQKKSLEVLVLREKRDKILKLKKNFKDIESFKNEMDKMLISKDDTVPFLRSIEEIASNTSTSIKIGFADLSKLKIANQKSVPVSNDEETVKDKTDSSHESAAKKAAKAAAEQASQLKKKIGLSIELLGTYSEIVNFLDKMENLPYFIDVYKMDLDGSGGLKRPAAAAAVPPAGDPAINPEKPEENDIISATMLIIVNTNDGK